MQGVSQDPSRGAVSRGELVHVSPGETNASPEPSESRGPRPTLTLDLLNMVVSYKKMSLLLEPLTDVVELTRFLLGWRIPLCSLLVCILLDVLFLTVSEVGWFSACALGVSAPAALGYLQDRCRGGASEAELQRRRYHAVQRRDLQTVHLTKQEAMLEVKHLLKRLDELLSLACVSAECVYRVIYWEDHCTSSRFYGAVLAVLVLLYTAPVGWALAVLNTALFLWNRDFGQVLLDLRERVQPGRTQPPEGEPEPVDQELASLPDRTPTPTSVEVRRREEEEMSVGQM